jgi:hypothetical protein
MSLIPRIKVSVVFHLFHCAARRAAVTCCWSSRVGHVSDGLFSRPASDNKSEFCCLKTPIIFSYSGDGESESIVTRFYDSNFINIRIVVAMQEFCLEAGIQLLGKDCCSFTIIVDYAYCHENDMLALVLRYPPLCHPV